MYNNTLETVRNEKKVEDTVAFLARQELNSDDFSIASFKQEMRTPLHRKPQLKINCSLKKQKHEYLIHA